MSIYKLKKNYLLVSRASTAIYLILKTQKFEGKKVLVPSNICYAAIYPVIYAGAVPVFVDVDPLTGNVNAEIIREHIDGIDAMIIPHMYGNPVKDIVEIAKLCNENDVLLIEDCASAMGAEIDGKRCGSWGDYSVYSTGYSKTVDLNGGGIIISDNDLTDIEELYDSLQELKIESDANNSFFSKLYRLIRNDESQTLDTYIWKGLLEHLSELYIYKCHKFDEELQNVDSYLDRNVLARREQNKLYGRLIRRRDLIYEYSVGAVPWRFSLFLPQDRRRTIIDKLLEKKIPVSDWYPVVTPIFGVSREKYPNALLMERKIVNFPLLIEEDEIKRICDVVNTIIDEELTN